MAAGEDVTDIEWEPPHKEGGGPGEVTIEHRVVGDVITPMMQDDARRLADRVFGDDKEGGLRRSRLTSVGVSGGGGAGQRPTDGDLRCGSWRCR